METAPIVSRILADSGIAGAVMMLVIALLTFALKALWSKFNELVEKYVLQFQKNTEAISKLTALIESRLK